MYYLSHTKDGTIHPNIPKGGVAYVYHIFGYSIFIMLVKSMATIHSIWPKRWNEYNVLRYKYLKNLVLNTVTLLWRFT